MGQFCSTDAAANDPFGTQTRHPTLSSAPKQQRIIRPPFPRTLFQNSVKASQHFVQQNPYNTDHKSPCKHNYVDSWAMDTCNACGIKLPHARFKFEKQIAQTCIREDAASKIDAEASHHRGVHALWLICFTFDHNCWDWPTWKVVRDIIKPATADKNNRCRYVELPSVANGKTDKNQPFVGPAHTFLSHCWKTNFGDLVAAALHAVPLQELQHRYVWVDIFAVRQWPGNDADLVFRGVIQRCTRLKVSVSTNVGDSILTKKELDQHYMKTEEAKKIGLSGFIPFCRLWCIVELQAANQNGVIMDVIAGSVTMGKKNQNENNVPEILYDTSGGRMALRNMLAFAINVKDAQCAVSKDYDREMKTIQNDQGGIKRLNELITMVLIGAYNNLLLHRSFKEELSQESFEFAKSYSNGDVLRELEDTVLSERDKKLAEEEEEEEEEEVVEEESDYLLIAKEMRDFQRELEKDKLKHEEQTNYSRELSKTNVGMAKRCIAESLGVDPEEYDLDELNLMLTNEAHHHIEYITDMTELLMDGLDEDEFGLKFTGNGLSGWPFG
jgi:hypothetical protein